MVVNARCASTATSELGDLPEIKHRISEIKARGSSWEVSRLLYPIPMSEAPKPSRVVPILLSFQASYQILRACSHGRPADVLYQPGQLRTSPFSHSVQKRE